MDFVRDRILELLSFDVLPESIASSLVMSQKVNVRQIE
jgi:hypothetical protein